VGKINLKRGTKTSTTVEEEWGGYDNESAAPGVASSRTKWKNGGL
jgi:hypothetical protein